MTLTDQTRHRAAGVLLAQACGDALGVPYEFDAPPEAEATMRGGGLGPYAPGEWSDDTQQAVCIAGVAATGVDLTSDDALDDIAEAFFDWLDTGASDVGVQTHAVLTAARHGSGRPAARMRAASRRHFERTGRAGGNGALMRTGIVGLTALGDRAATAAAARAVAELTHGDPLAGDSCVLWSEAVRVAATEGRLHLEGGLDLIPPARRDQWATAIHLASTSRPQTFAHNGFTVTALQAAWAAIVTTLSEGRDAAHLQRALHAAVRIGHDTDTVAAIAGQLLGARYGASAVPAKWRRVVHGWPGLRARDLVRLALDTACGGGPAALERMDYVYDRTPAIQHPLDEGLLLGTYLDLREREHLGYDAVVSLCRVGAADLIDAAVPSEDHVEVWLIDSDEPDSNPNLDFVLRDTVDVITELRAEGKRVLVHCVAAHNRTPGLAQAYAARLLGAHAGPAAYGGLRLPPPQRRGALWRACGGAT